MYKVVIFKTSLTFIYKIVKV